MNLYPAVVRALTQRDEKMALKRLKEDVKPGEFPLAHRLFQGVQENRSYLEGILKDYSRMPLERYRENHRLLMLVGLYGILFLNKADYAIVNQLVEDIRQVAPGLTGMSNAILRRAVREREVILNRDQDPLEEVGLHEDLKQALLKDYSQKDLTPYLKRMNEPSPFELFAMGERAALKDRLSEEGFDVNELSGTRRGLEIMNPRGIMESDAFLQGDFYIMSRSAQIVAQRIADLPGNRMLDLCAAPGGKSIAVQALSPEKKCHLNDRSQEKVARIGENLHRLKKKVAGLSVWDATRFYPQWEASFDLVLLDAPCSGSGILHRVAQIRSERDQASLATLQNLQRRLLHQASRYVRKNGFLIYVTCSILKDENQRQIEAFLKGHFDYQVVKESIDSLSQEGYLILDPLRESVDGFFACVMQKVK